MSSHSLRFLPRLFFLLVLATPVFGTHPVHRTFDRFEDFLKGEHKGISLTGDGRLILAPALVEELSTEEVENLMKFHVDQTIKTVGEYYNLVE